MAAASAMPRLDHREINDLTAFAVRGGLGTATALTDCIAEGPDQLMYIQGDTLILLRDFGEQLLASCEGEVGWVKRGNIAFDALASTSSPPSPSPRSISPPPIKWPGSVTPVNATGHDGTPPAPSPSSEDMPITPAHHPFLPADGGALQRKYASQSSFSSPRLDDKPPDLGQHTPYLSFLHSAAASPLEVTESPRRTTPPPPPRRRPTPTLSADRSAIAAPLPSNSSNVEQRRATDDGTGSVRSSTGSGVISTLVLGGGPRSDDHSTQDKSSSPTPSVAATLSLSALGVYSSAPEFSPLRSAPLATLGSNPTRESLRTVPGRHDIATVSPAHRQSLAAETESSRFSISGYMDRSSILTQVDEDQTEMLAYSSSADHSSTDLHLPGSRSSLARSESDENIATPRVSQSPIPLSPTLSFHTFGMPCSSASSEPSTAEKQLPSEPPTVPPKPRGGGHDARITGLPYSDSPVSESSSFLRLAYDDQRDSEEDTVLDTPQATHIGSFSASSENGSLLPRLTLGDSDDGHQQLPLPEKSFSPAPSSIFHSSSPSSTGSRTSTESRSLGQSSLRNGFNHLAESPQIESAMRPYPVQRRKKVSTDASFDEGPIMDASRSPLQPGRSDSAARRRGMMIMGKMGPDLLGAQGYLVNPAAAVTTDPPPRASSSGATAAQPTPARPPRRWAGPRATSPSSQPSSDAGHRMVPCQPFPARPDSPRVPSPAQESMLPGAVPHPGGPAPNRAGSSQSHTSYSSLSGFGLTAAQQLVATHNVMGGGDTCAAAAAARMASARGTPVGSVTTRGRSPFSPPPGSCDSHEMPSPASGSSSSLGHRARSRSFSAALAKSFGKARGGHNPNLSIDTSIPLPLPTREVHPTTAPGRPRNARNGPSDGGGGGGGGGSVSKSHMPSDSYSAHRPSQDSAASLHHMSIDRGPSPQSRPFTPTQRPFAPAFALPSHSRSASQSRSNWKGSLRGLTSLRNFGESPMHTPINASGLEFELVQPGKAAAPMVTLTLESSGLGLLGSEDPHQPSSVGHGPGSDEISTETDEWGFLKYCAPTPEIFQTRTPPSEIRAAELKWIGITSQQLGRGQMPPKRVRRMVIEQGLPASVRGRVWTWLMSGGMSGYVPGLFQTLVSGERGRWDERICKDVETVYADHAVFYRPGCVGQQELRTLLRAYVHFAPNGYHPEIALIAGALLIHAQVEDAFWLLAGLFNGVLKTYYVRESGSFRIDLHVFAGILQGSEPRIAKLFHDVGIPPHDYVERWWTSLFIRSLPWPTVLRIFDAVISEGPRFLLIASLAVLTLSRERLMSLPRNHAAVVGYLRNLPQDSLLLPENFMRACDQVKLRDEDLRKLRINVKHELAAAGRLTERELVSAAGR